MIIDFMKLKEIIYFFFYLLAFTLALWAGFTMGFTDSHTPPVPFLIEFLCIPIGLILFFVDLFNKSIPRTFLNFRVHIIGLTINIAVMVYVLMPAF